MERWNQHGGLTIVPMPGFEGMATQLQQLIQEKYTDTPVDMATPVFGERASCEPFLKLGKDHIGGHDCVVLTSGPGTYEMQGMLYLLLNYLGARRAARIAVVTAYFPLSRSDKDEGGLELALPPYVVHMMQCACYGALDRVIAFDLHASQIVMAAGQAGMITEVSMTKRVLQQAVEDALSMNAPIVVHFPDEGSMKRCEDAVKAVAEQLGVTLYTTNGTKRRTDSRHSEVGAIYGDQEKLRDAIVIMLDDEGATMGTNMQSATMLHKNFGPRAIYAAFVHPVLCGKAVMLISDPNSPIKGIICTDTIPIHTRPEIQHLVDEGRIKIVSCAKDLAHIIGCHHWDISIRTLR